MKLLVAVGELPTEGAPPPGVAALVAAATEIQVMSPTLVGRLDWFTSDTAEARHEADDRLTEMLGRISEEPVDVSVSTAGRGELAHNALAAALAEFDADHVLIVAAASDALWRRFNVVERLLLDHGKTVTITLV